MITFSSIERQAITESSAWQLGGFHFYGGSKLPERERWIDYMADGDGPYRGTVVKARGTRDTPTGFAVSGLGGTVNFDMAGRAEIETAEGTKVYQLLDPLRGDELVADIAMRIASGEDKLTGGALIEQLDDAQRGQLLSRLYSKGEIAKLVERAMPLAIG
jgi:hypothetical protein